MGRTSTARDRLLDAACDLMQGRAYGSLGVAEICARADVRKGSFYHFFESKQALTLAAIDTHWRTECETWDAALSGNDPALTRLARLVRALTDAHRASRDTRGAVTGCLLANLTIELSGADPLAQARLEEIFNEQIALVQAVIADAVDEGMVPAASLSRGTARAIVAQIEGLVLFAKLGNDPDVLGDLWVQVLHLLRVPTTQLSDPRAPRT
jgi:TetR/AcrR family transcriptional repressor of nem operon